MKSAKAETRIEWLAPAPDAVTGEVTEADEKRFFRITSTDLSPEQRDRILYEFEPHPRQRSVLAVHWHPEFVPMDLIERRIDAVFPKRDTDLIIPTQHNVLTSYNRYTGVEVDCYSRGFNRKVQLLVHFENGRLDNAHTFRKMLAHTFKYRSSQLFDFIRTITDPVEERISEAARQTGADQGLVRFVRANVEKIRDLLNRYEDRIAPESIKNKLLRNWFDDLREDYGGTLIDRCQYYLKAVKAIVKANFSLDYFYRTSEVIEEVRAYCAGIVIPHPEQFWPILLAEYDVDGYEVWNPQSRQYTEFLIEVLNGKNRKSGPSVRRLLVFMGDDTHMGEKTRPPGQRDPEKAGREIGVQPPWEDLAISKVLIKAEMDRNRIIREYADRLAG